MCFTRTDMVELRPGGRIRSLSESPQTYKIEEWQLAWFINPVDCGRLSDNLRIIIHEWLIMTLAGVRVHAIETSRLRLNRYSYQSYRLSTLYLSNSLKTAVTLTEHNRNDSDAIEYVSIEDNC